MAYTVLNDVRVPWQGKASSSSAMTNTSVQTAPGTGKALVLRQFILTSVDANSFQLLNGSGGDSLVGTIYIGANQSLTYKFVNPLKLAANTALCVTTTAATNAGVICEGSIEAA